MYLLMLLLNLLFLSAGVAVGSADAVVDDSVPLSQAFGTYANTTTPTTYVVKFKENYVNIPSPFFANPHTHTRKYLL